MKRWTAAFAVALLGVSTLAFGLTPQEELGKSLFFDKISSPGSMACAACHGPSVGFTGPTPGVNLSGGVYPGAVPQRFGNRKPPSAAYATFAPIFDFDMGEGLFIGGNFWDGRATGEHLGNPAADQALGPFLNPVEQNNPSKTAVLQTVAGSHYAWMWEVVWGEPISWATTMDVDKNYDRVGLAIAAYEASPEVNAFSSKFDFFWHNAMDAGMDVAAIDMSNWRSYLGLGLDKTEVEGLAVFNDEDKGNCAACHVLDPVTDTSGNVLPPLFTDFTFDNLGTPRNPLNPFYDMDEVYLGDGTPINPMGDAWVDDGLGGFLANHPNPAWQAMAAENMGKQKVPTLRNVGKAPTEEFPKTFTHNGYFTSLKEVVHFYNTRDVDPKWPAPEVAMNVNSDELGDLGLSKKEETLLVVFMNTLSDGWTASPGTIAMAPRAAAQITLTPNPLGPASTVAYTLPVAGSVHLRLYDVSGRLVTTLVEGAQGAGVHRVRLSTDTLASGVYFVRLQTATETATARAVLLR